MELKPGFKRTEVGIIPDDWMTLCCDVLSKMITVGIVIRPTQYYVPHGVPAFRSANIREKGINGSDLVFISEEANARLSKSQVQAGDVLTVRTGYPGTSAVVPPQYAGSNCIDILITRPSPKVNSHYLAGWINSPFGKFQVLRDQGGLAQQHFNVGDLRNLVVALPPTKAEQEAIAGAMGDVDGLIDSLERLIAKKRQIKQAVMQQLLTGKKRLPGFSGEWAEVSLGQMGKCYRGVSYNPSVDLSPSDAESTVRLLRSNNVQEAAIVFNDMQFVSSSRVSAEQLLRSKDVLICMANGSRSLVGKAGRFLADDGFKYTFGAFMSCFRPDFKAANPDYVFYLFQTQKYHRHIAVLLAGSSINNLTPCSVEALSINVPCDKSEQAAVAEILSDMDVEIAELGTKLEKASQIKQGMMQNLLTGTIRLI